MIFISHNYKDKEIVEPIAIAIAQVFGRDKTFYDSWSMQPGDGIIDKMNQALTQCTHFFFFVSSNSLASKMVSLEWQNALYRATNGSIKIIPVRIGDCELPPIMAQNIYVDILTHGIDVGIRQIIDILSGNSTFRPLGAIKNLFFKLSINSKKNVSLTISARNFLEPIGKFLIALGNAEEQVTVTVPNDSPFNSGFHNGIPLNNGQLVNAHYVGIFRGITPKHPLIINLTSPNADIDFKGVMHQVSHDKFEFIPQTS